MMAQPDISTPKKVLDVQLYGKRRCINALGLNSREGRRAPVAHPSRPTVGAELVLGARGRCRLPGRALSTCSSAAGEAADLGRDHADVIEAACGGRA